MSYPHCYEYPRPAVTVDLLVFARSDQTTEVRWRVLLVRRRRPPFAGLWAVPGGFLDMDEKAADAARRELREETGLDDAGPIAFLGVYDDLDRDPRGRTISLAFVARLEGPLQPVRGGDDAAEAAWVDPLALEEEDLAFDHAKILADGWEWLMNVHQSHTGSRSSFATP